MKTRDRKFALKAHIRHLKKMSKFYYSGKYGVGEFYSYGEHYFAALIREIAAAKPVIRK